MRTLIKILASSAAALSLGYANAAIFTLDGFDDASLAATTETVNSDSDTVTDSNNNDLFATRMIVVNSTGANQAANIQADMSVADSLAYSAETGVTSDYLVGYVLDGPVDLTAGKGVAGMNDFFEVFVAATDFKALIEVSVNGGSFSTVGEIPAGVNQIQPPLTASFALNTFMGDLTAVTTLDFRFTPLDFNNNPAAAADGQFDFLRFNVEGDFVPPQPVPVPGSLLMIGLGLLGLRKVRTTS